MFINVVLKVIIFIFNFKFVVNWVNIVRKKVCVFFYFVVEEKKVFDRIEKKEEKYILEYDIFFLNIIIMYDYVLYDIYFL